MTALTASIFVLICYLGTALDLAILGVPVLAAAIVVAERSDIHREKLP